jgi:hypothetical protein
MFELLENMARYRQGVINAQVRIKDQEKQIEITRKQLFSTGLPETNRWRYLEKDIERLAVSKTTLNALKIDLAYRVELSAERIFRWYDDIQDDLAGGYITQKAFLGYLNDYNSILEASKDLDLECFSKGPAEKVINAITKDLGNFTTNEISI